MLKNMKHRECPAGGNFLLDIPRTTTYNTFIFESGSRDFPLVLLSREFLTENHAELMRNER